MAVVTILGAGSWGTALATHLARLGHEVALWARNPEFSAQLAAAGENAVYLPGVRFPPGLEPIASLAEACVRSRTSRRVRLVVDLMTRGLKRETD